MRVALMRLDGMGGTVTVSDQAKKIYELTKQPVTLIIRKYKELFYGNPYVGNIIEVGYGDNNKVLAKYKSQFDVFCDVRFVVGKWYYKEGVQPITEVDFTKWETIYDRHPTHRDLICKEVNDIDVYDLNQTQIVDMSLGLPYDTIDSQVFVEKKYRGTLPKDFIIITNGVDIQHGSMRQTKQWDYWDKLIPLLPLPVVQVGTLQDPLAANITCDLRSKTDLLQLVYLMRRAAVVVCCEGGLMHLAYAASYSNVVVLRGPSSGVINKYPNQVTVDSCVCDNCWWTIPNWYQECGLGIDCICMKSIPPERVAYNVLSLLGGSNEILV